MDFPAIYKAASDCSAMAQSHFYKALRLELMLLIASAVISVLEITHWTIAVLQAALLLAALACTLFLYQRKDKPDRIWYQARALAESIKTMTWRFVSKAEPYTADLSDVDVEHAFLKNLEDLRRGNQLPYRYLVLPANAVSITETMRTLRERSLEERKEYYIKNRIDDQKQWYKIKSRTSHRLANRYTFVVVVTYVTALLLALTRIRFPAVDGWPTGVAITAAVAVKSWMQAKRFSELAASYSQTGADIHHLKEVMQADARHGRLATEDAFSRFVGDAENAFSREHTQWLARRDN